MHGLTVRWSLEDAAEGTERRLMAYVAESSHSRFTDMPGLRFKTWRLRPREWFEGLYVFETNEARREFQESFTASAGDSPGSQIVGAPPVLIEPCEVVAVAEGASGFVVDTAYR